jgi:DNA replication licensing factor MCM5
VFGRYDDMKSAVDNIDFQSTILSRFDLIFIIRDVRDIERDERVARHVMSLHSGASANEKVCAGCENFCTTYSDTPHKKY